MVRGASDSAPARGAPGLGVSATALRRHHRPMTGPDVAMLALTAAGFAGIALLPYAAFRLLEAAETAIARTRSRA